MSTHNFKIVIVDDDQAVLDVLKQKVIDLGYQVETFNIPENSIEYLEKNYRRVSMVISDFKMESMNGFELKKKLNKTSKSLKEIPYIIVTGFFNKDLAKEGLSRGVNALLEKPVQDEELKKTILELTASREEMLKDEIEMIDGFLEEGEPLMEDIENLILSLEADPGDNDLLNTYFRLLHTIKGTAACVGLQNLADLSHKYEDFISVIRNNPQSIDSRVINVLLKGFDSLKLMMSLVKESSSDENFDISSHVKIFEEFDFNKKDSPAQAQSTSKETSSRADSADVKTKEKESDKMNVSLSLLDDFMELSGELTVIRNSIVKTVKTIEQRYKGDANIELLNDLLGGMHKITSNMQTQIYELRKVPLKNIFRPFKRLIRDISRSLKKDVVLETQGEEILVDTSVSKLLSNTMIHLLRNSLDHGIEAPEDREKKGKKSQGRVVLSGKEIGEDIVINIQDDGKGIDPEIIKKIAVEKELYTPAELEVMPNSEIFKIIFESGFSTAQEVTDLSGRGVGMDMVRSSIEETGGRISIESEIGKGTTFSLIIPIPKSVLIINALLVKSFNQTFVISMDNVSEVLRVTPDRYSEKIYKVENSLALSHNECIYPIVVLTSIFDKDFVYNKDETLTIVILRGKKIKYAIMVDAIEDFEEVVIKGLAERDNEFSLFRGASLLGNGSIALILDVEGIASREGVRPIATKKHFEEKGVEKIKAYNEEDDFMLFDLDGEGKYCIGLNLVNRLEKMSTKDFSVSGSSYLIRYRDTALPLIFLEKELCISGRKIQDIIDSSADADVIVVEHEKQLYGLVVNKMYDIGKSTSKVNTTIKNQEGFMGTVFINNATYTVVDGLGIVKKYLKRTGESSVEVA